MHEFSVATQIFESVSEFFEAHEAADISVVRLEIGEMMCIEREQLVFCYNSIKELTPLRNSSLEITVAPAIVQCPSCQYEGIPKYLEGFAFGTSIPTLQCPRCGRAAEAIQGHDCVIKSVQLIDPKVRPPKFVHHECDPFDNPVLSES